MGGQSVAQTAAGRATIGKPIQLLQLMGTGASI
jgi:hypothetical protein